MSYQKNREAEQVRTWLRGTDDFIGQSIRNKRAGLKRRTIFLFPGGMASKLRQAKQAYNPQLPPNQMFNYETKWGTICSFAGDALDLKMNFNTVDQTWHDRNERIMIADGYVTLGWIDPYDRFLEWCETNAIDVYVIGWDWRRRLDDTIKPFVERFLPAFRQRVMQAGAADPLENYFLVGHSFGGMVANMLARRSNLPGTMAHAIAVATPFYGYGGQIMRWFEGDRQLFALMDEMKVIRTISSFPGCYMLPFLDIATFSANAAVLTTGPLKLPGYPAINTASPPAMVDAFIPSSPSQYPANTEFNLAALAAGLTDFRKLSAPMPENAHKFTAIRGIRVDRSGTVIADTPGGLFWRPVANPHDPGNSPLAPLAPVPGDDTLPAWSTRLIGSPSIEIRHKDVEHAYMMELDETHAKIAALI